VVEAPPRRSLGWGKLIGMDENFTLSDKWIAGGLFGWSMLWVGIFAIGTVWNLVASWPESAWSAYWHIADIGVPILMSIVTAIWFTWGGVRDIRGLFARLKEQRIDHLYDGTVVGHQNRDESSLPNQRPQTATVMNQKYSSCGFTTFGGSPPSLPGCTKRESPGESLWSDPEG